MVDIPDINQIKNSILEKKKSKKIKIYNYNNKRNNNILKNRINNRKNWSIKRKENHDKFLIKLKKANDNLINAISQEIINKTKFVLENNSNTKGFNLVNPHNIDCELNNFSPNTIFKGFWNPKNKRHSKINHLEANIKKHPILVLSNKFKKYGYIIEDISDESNNNEIIIRVTFNFK